jgi:hypothetical protein
MGLMLFLKNSGYSSYSRNYKSLHIAKNWILEYYKATIDISYCYTDAADQYPETSFKELDILYSNLENKKLIEKYKMTLNKLNEKGILSLAPLLLHSDCDGEIPYHLCGPMIPLLNEIINKYYKMINGKYILLSKKSLDDENYYGLGVVLSLYDMIKKSHELKDDIIFA